MPISILETPEPLTEASATTPPTLIASDASRLLAHALLRYCAGEVSGRSFLVSGHRGAGKTMLVAAALEEVIKADAESNLPRRPLFIPLHGPNLLPNKRPAPAPVVVDPVAPQPRTVLVYTDPAEAKPAVEPDSEMQTVLKQITLGLHRALAREVVRSFRARILDNVADWTNWTRVTRGRRGPSVGAFHAQLNQDFELAAQLEVELFECPAPSRLRDFWARAGFLHSGILRPAGRTPSIDLEGRRERHRVRDAGLRELVAVSAVCEAYRRISGTFTQEERREDAAAAKSEVALGASLAGKDLYGPLLSLLTGALVGAGLRGSGVSPYPAAISGILSALGSAIVIKYSATRSRERSMSRQYTFLYDLSVATLDRTLPILVDRLRQAGLAPVFVVDELDKVEDLSNRIVGMVQHLKKFVAESAFFVFITDRSYFETFRRRIAAEPFPVEHTYFGQQLYIVFRPNDLRAYIERVIRDPRTGTHAVGGEGAGASGDEADYPLLAPILLHRARMHPIDLRREIAELRDDQGNVRLRSGVVRTSRAFQFDLRMQIAIEYLIVSNEDLASTLEQEPAFRRLANDAMYYLSRRWAAEPDAPLDLGPDDVDKLRDYLVRRMGKDRPVSTEPAAGAAAVAPAPSPTPEIVDLERVAPSDGKLLRQVVYELAELLANDTQFRARLKEWNAKPKLSADLRIPQPVLDALDAMPFDLVARVGTSTTQFEWNFYPSGRPRTDTARARVNVFAAHANWKESAEFILLFGKALDVLTP